MCMTGFGHKVCNTRDCGEETVVVLQLRCLPNNLYFQQELIPH